MVDQMRTIAKPQVGEYPTYASMYIDLLPDDGQVLQHLQANIDRVYDVVSALPTDKLIKPHTDGEWTVQEILVHVIDDERIYAYRALRFARGDTTSLPGFEQDTYVPPSRANQRTLDDIFDEYRTVRQSTIHLFNSMDDAILMRSGTADGKQATVRALAYHIAGHELHHLNSIIEHYGPM